MGQHFKDLVVWQKAMEMVAEVEYRRKSRQTVEELVPDKKCDLSG